MKPCSDQTKTTFPTKTKYDTIRFYNRDIWIWISWEKRRVKAGISYDSSSWRWQALFIKLVVIRFQATFKCSKESWIVLWKEFNLASWHRWDYQYLFFYSNYSVVLKWVVESGRTWDRNLMISEFILACTKFNQIGVFVVFMFLFECVHVRVCFVKTFAQHSSS